MVYSITLLFLLINILIFDVADQKNGRKLMYKLSFIFFVLIAGLRWKVGGDTLVYQKVFEEDLYNVFNLSENFKFIFDWNIGFTFFIALCKTLVNEFWFFQLMQAIIVNYIIFNLIKQYTFYRFTALFIYAFCFYFNFNTEVLREIFSICIFVYIYKYLINKKYIKYYIGVVLAALFHTSALLLIVYPFLIKRKIGIKEIIILIITFIIVSLSLVFLPSIAIALGSSEDTVNKLSYYSSKDFSIFGFVYLIIAYLVFPYCVYRFNQFNQLRQEFDSLIFPYFLIVTIMVAAPGFDRFLNYLGPFIIVYFANTLGFIYHVNKYKNLRIVIILALIIGPLYFKFTYYTSSVNGVLTNAIYKRYEAWLPYTSVLTRDEDFTSQRIDLHKGTMSKDR